MPARLNIAWRRWRPGLAALLLAWGCGGAQAAVPTTFGTIVGNALLCRDEVDNKYFYNYVLNALGPAYKHDGGAYWF
jgi:hypothetical protein